MRDHDMGGWRFAHTIGLIQHTKAVHCVAEMWAIAEMNSNWKVWMASLIKSKHAERQIIFWSRLFMLYLDFHTASMWAVSCRITAVGVFCHSRKEKVSICLTTLLPGRKGTLSFLQYRDMLSPSRLSRCMLPMKMEAWNVPSSQAVQYEWPFCLISLSAVHSERHVWLTAAHQSIQTGTHMHVINSYKLHHSLQSSWALLSFFRVEMGK